MIARSHEVDLVDTWRADSQSLNVARLARNYRMCENALARDRDGINLSQKCPLVREACKVDSILPGSRKIFLPAFRFFAFLHSQGQIATELRCPR